MILCYSRTAFKKKTETNSHLEHLLLTNKPALISIFSPTIEHTVTCKISLQSERGKRVALLASFFFSTKQCQMTHSDLSL